MPTNFLNPVGEARVYPDTGDPLILNSWSSQPNTPFLESIDVTSKLQGISKISVQTSFPYDMFIRLLQERPLIFSPESILEVMVGYTGTGIDGGEFTKTFQSILNKPDPSFDNDRVSLTLAGDGKVGRANTREASINFENVTVYQAIKKVANTHGMTLFFKDSDGKVKEMDNPYRINGCAKKLNHTFKRSDSEILKYLIEVKAGQEFYVDGSRIILCDLESTLDRDESDLVLTYRRGPDFQNGVYPIQSISPKNFTERLTSGAYNVRQKKVDPKTKEVNTIEKLASSEDVRLPFTDSVSYPDFIEDTIEVVVDKAEKVWSTAKQVQENKEVSAGEFREDNYGKSVQAASTDPDAEEKAAKQKKDGQLSSGKQAQISTLGLPKLKPGDRVDVVGTNVYDGIYFVVSNNHAFGTDGYSSTLELFDTTGAINAGLTELMEQRISVPNTESTTGDQANKNTKEVKPND